MADKVLNIAHRGARSLAPENTLAAARKAWEIGADMWELDVTMTADGELVLLHDVGLARTSNIAEVFPDRGDALLTTFTMAELRQLDMGGWFVQADPFSQIADGQVPEEEQLSFKGTPIPSLRAALELTRDLKWRVNVEIKNLDSTAADDTIAERVVALIAETGMLERVVISSFNHDYLARVRRASRQIATAALVGFPAPDPVALLRGLDAQAYNPGNHNLELEQLGPLRRAGFEVNIWTVNDPERMRELISAGATGIITDFPQWFPSSG